MEMDLQADLGSRFSSDNLKDLFSPDQGKFPTAT